MAFPADGQSFFFFQAGVMRRIQLSGIRPAVAVRMSVFPTELNGFVSAKKAELVAPERLSVKKNDRRQRGRHSL